MIHLRELTLNKDGVGDGEYPFNVQAVKNISRLTFESPVTIFVGENGSGKSTLLEGLAMAVGSVAIGREDISRDQAFKAVAPLAAKMNLVWNKRTHRGFFLRAEDFFGFVQRIRSLRQEMLDELNRIDQDYAERSAYARSLAKGPAASSVQAMDRQYGEDLDAHSHGESFLTIFQSRFVPNGLYLLDEPEAALSPLRQLGLISLIKQMVLQDAQFILATHSPILMAIPGANILDLDQSPPVYRDYQAIDQVILYRAFLDDPEAFIRRL
ncbi:MAG: AAA family ATPase [Brevefilum sp.]|nr:AAA family ATPase [Brevefilum sp.]